ncbi:MAG: FtsX-like permease family protein [Bacteroidota bacterium]
MFSHYVKTSLRALRRSKTHTTINLLGLTLGLLCATLLFQKLRYETSFDTHHPDPERTFRIVHEDTEFGDSDFNRGTPYPLAAAFREAFPEADRVVLVDRNFGRLVIAVEHPEGRIDRFREEGTFALAQPGFFDLFGYEWLAGDRETALDGPYTAVISVSRVAKYFGADTPPAEAVGRLFRFNNMVDLTVTGVVGDPAPANSMPLHGLVSFNLGESYDRINDNWGSVSSGVQTFVRLREGTSEATVEARLPDFVAQHWDAERAPTLHYELQPIRTLHTDDRYGVDGSYTMPKSDLVALGAIGILLLLTACINFVNLNTALVFRRAKEVGVRKAVGGTPGQIIVYFMTETALVTAFALALALLLTNPVRGLIEPFFGDSLAVNLFADPGLVAFALGTGVLLTVLSGFYPAWLLSRLRASEVVKGQLRTPGGFLNVRRGLVVTQFAISQILVIGTLAALYQTQYLRTAPLGYETSAVVEFDIPQEREGVDLDTFVARLVAHGPIEQATLSNSGATSNSTWLGDFNFEKEGQQIENDAHIKLVEEDYLETYRMRLLAGRDFVPGDSSGILVNEAMVRLMGYDAPAEALGTPLEFWDWGGTVTGVVQDFHTRSLHEAIEPTIIVVATDYAFVGAARIQMNDRAEALAAIEDVWTDVFPNHLFEAHFLDDTIADLYESEEHVQRTVNAFAFVAIVIGCIGLFGLVSYITAQRAKEVSVRKVLGASTGHIVGRFTREFVILVVLGFIVAAPVAFFTLRGWLSDYAYRIDLGPGLFLTGFAVSLVVALATVGAKTYRAASADPASTLRAG